MMVAMINALRHRKLQRITCEKNFNFVATNEQEKCDENAFPLGERKKEKKWREKIAVEKWF